MDKLWIRAILNSMIASHEGLGSEKKIRQLVKTYWLMVQVIEALAIGDTSALANIAFNADLITLRDMGEDYGLSDFEFAMYAAKAVMKEIEKE